MSDETIKAFLYRPSRLKIAALFALALWCACLMGYFAVNPGNKPVNACGIEITPAQFQIVAITGVSLSPIGIVPLAIVLWFSFTHNGRIAFTASSVILPKPNLLGLSYQEIELPFSEIDSVSVKPFMGRTLMLQIIRESDGKVLYIFSNMFASKNDFERVRVLLWTALYEEGEWGAI